MQDNYNCISMVLEDGKDTGIEVVINFPLNPQENSSIRYEIKNIIEKLVLEKSKSYGGI